MTLPNSSSPRLMPILCALMAPGLAFAQDEAAEAPAAEGTPAADAPAADGGDDGLSIPYERFTLKNGLEVILHEDHRTPFVAVSVWYHVGAFHEAAGKTGFAHLFEHLMFQGTPNVGEDKHIAYLEEAGSSVRNGMVNGTTNEDRTNYFEVVPSHELELALWLEADRMGYLMDGMTQAKLDEQRGVVKNERLQGIENAPYGMAEEALWQKVFPKTHPYYGMVIGSLADLDAATLDDVRGFYDTYYAPSNATLTLAGDFDPKVARVAIEKYFGTLPPWDKPAKKEVAPPTVDKGFTFTFKERVGKLPKIEIMWLTPAFFAEGDAALDVVAQILARGKASTLYQALVEGEQVAQSVSAYQSSNQNVSTFQIDITLKPDVDATETVELVFAYLAELSDLPPEQKKVTNALNALETERLFGLQKIGGFSGKAEQLQLYNHYLGEPDYLQKDLERYRAVTPEKVSEAVKGFLARDKAAIMIVQPLTPEELAAEQAAAAEKAAAEKAAAEKAAAEKAEAAPADDKKDGAEDKAAPTEGKAEEGGAS